MHFFLILLEVSHLECSHHSVRKSKTPMERSWREEIGHMAPSSDWAPSQHQFARHITKTSLKWMIQPLLEQHCLMLCGAKTSHLLKSLPTLHICKQNKCLLLFKVSRVEGSYVKVYNHYWWPMGSIITRFPITFLTSALLPFFHLFSDFGLSNIPLPQGPYACSYVCLEYFSPIYPHALLPHLHLISNMTLSVRTFWLLFFSS